MKSRESFGPGDLARQHVSTSNLISGGASVDFDTLKEVEDVIKSIQAGGIGAVNNVTIVGNKDSIKDLKIAGKIIENNGEIFNDYTNNKATGSSSHAEGYKTTASGKQSHAEGNKTVASGANAHAEGSETIASDGQAHAEGKGTTASGGNSHAEGRDTLASGDNSHAEGCNTEAKARSAHAEGEGNTTYGKYSHAEGYNNGISAKAEGAHIEGLSSSIDYRTTLKLSKEDLSYDDITDAWKNNKFAMANGIAAHVEGKDCLALGDYSHAEGSDSIAAGVASHAEGASSAEGDYSHAEGDSVARGDYSHAEGTRTIAYYTNAHAEGLNTRAGEHVSALINNGDDLQGYFYGVAAHAEGCNTRAQTDYCHAEGYSTEAGAYTYYATDWSGSGDYRESRCESISIAAHAEGYNTRAIGKYSHAEGQETWAGTEVNIDNHTTYGKTKAVGTASHAEGCGTRAYSDYQHTEGKWNVTDSANKFAHIIGNGTSDTARSNALAIDWNGNIYVNNSETGVNVLDLLNRIVELEKTANKALVTDDTTGIVYQFGIDNGETYFREYKENL